MFSEATLTDIRSRLDIVELIGEYVPLKKSGQSYSGLCPFHGEKTASFHVHPVKQCFHCFGCQKGGNIFSFYLAIEGISFPEAVRKLADRAGVRVEEDYQRKKTENRPPVSEMEVRCLEALEWAAKYFHFLLTTKQEYRFALDYLKSRGIQDETIRKFRIGVSPRGWSTLISAMKTRKFTIGELIDAGLAIEKKDNPIGGYDRFRGRLMFPILNPEGRVGGFGARLLDNEANQPKYINSPESPLFSKRSLLYGLHENQRGIRLRGETVIVEGYMDVVGLYQAGVKNAVATMGTALTEEHCQLLKALSLKVVTVFDPDSAGIEAWQRSVHLCLESGLFAKDLSLPNNLDPDEYVLAGGAEAFYGLCERAPKQVTKLLKEFASKAPLSEGDTTRAIELLTPILRASRRLAERAILWDDIALVLKVSLNSLKQIAEGGSQTNRPKKSASPAAARPAKRVQPEAKLPSIEVEFLKVSLSQPIGFIKQYKDIWGVAVTQRNIRAWLELLSEAEDPQVFEQQVTGLMQKETHPSLIQLASERLLQSVAGKHSLNPAEPILERLRHKKKEIEIKALSAQIRLSDRLGQSQEQMTLLERIQELRST